MVLEPGKKRWMKEKTSTCPRGESGMMRMITKGTSVTKSLRIRRSSFTCNTEVRREGVYRGGGCEL